MNLKRWIKTRGPVALFSAVFGVLLTLCVTPRGGFESQIEHFATVYSHAQPRVMLMIQQYNANKGE